jgi:hypothetical protein
VFDFIASMENKKNIYGVVGKDVQESLRQLEAFMENPSETISAFTNLRYYATSEEELYRILKGEEFAEEINEYVERLKINKEKGLDVSVEFLDIVKFMKYAFRELDSKVDPNSIRYPGQCGRRVYTGQSEQPGPNPGYYLFYK